jgi:hypothetical protein
LNTLIQLFANSSKFKGMISSVLGGLNEIDSIKKDIKSYDTLLNSHYGNFLKTKSKNIDFYHHISFSDYKDGLNYERLYDNRVTNKDLLESKKRITDRLIKVIEKNK